RARGERAAGLPGRPRRAPRPEGLARPVGRPADRRARRPRRRRDAGHVQRRHWHGRDGRARGGGPRGRSAARRRDRRHRDRRGRAGGRRASLRRGADRATRVSERHGRIAVAVSGQGSNLRALHAAGGRGELGGEIVLVLADRACPALDWAAEQGSEMALLPRGDAGTAAEALPAARPDVVVVAGYMRILGSNVLEAFPGRILNTHASRLPAFAGAHAVLAALSHGAKGTGATVHLVDATLDGGPIVVQEA